MQVNGEKATFHLLDFEARASSANLLLRFSPHPSSARLRVQGQFYNPTESSLALAHSSDFSLSLQQPSTRGAPLSPRRQMSSSSPSRVLGSADSQPYSDNPYSPTPQDHAEVDSLEPANERTSLLSSSSPNVRKKAGPRTASARSDPASFSAAGEEDEEDLRPTARVVRRRPWSLKLDFGIACILLCTSLVDRRGGIYS